MSEPTKQFNVRLPKLTQGQVADLEAKTGMTITQIIIMAIERMHKEEIKTEKPDSE